MTCDEARLALLDAEPDELRGAGSGELVVHLRDCAVCAAEAASIISRTHELRAVVDRAVAAGVALHVSRAGDNVAASPPRRLIRARTLIPLATAAGLAMLVLLDGAELRIPFGARSESVGFHVPPVQVPDAPVVNASGVRGVAVMRTMNPDITVVWNF